MLALCSRDGYKTGELTAVIDLDFGAGGHLYATHQLHAFAARCPAPVARWAIESYTKPGDVVLDPMVGSGTTLVEARLYGRHAWGCNIDPLARLDTEGEYVLMDEPTDDPVMEAAQGASRGISSGVPASGAHHRPGATGWAKLLDAHSVPSS